MKTILNSVIIGFEVPPIELQSDNSEEKDLLLQEISESKPDKLNVVKHSIETLESDEGPYILLYTLIVSYEEDSFPMRMIQGILKEHHDNVIKSMSKYLDSKSVPYSILK